MNYQISPYRKLQFRKTYFFNIKYLFPLYLFVLIVFQPFFEEFTLFGFRFVEYLIYYFYIIFLLKTLKKKNYFLILLNTIFIIFIVFSVIHAIVYNYSTFENIVNIRKLGLHLYIYSSLAYCYLYGSKIINKYLFFAFIISNLIYIFDTILGDGDLHSAFIAFSSVFIFLYALSSLQKQKILVNKSILFFIIVLNISLPFLGMTRGGILAIVTIIILVIGFYAKSLRSFVKITSQLLVISVFAFFFYSHFSGILTFHHLSSQNILELFNKTVSSSDSYEPRIIRWTYMFNLFVQNPFIGRGFVRELNLFSHQEMTSAWGAHNYFISLMGGGGIILLFPILFLYIKLFKIAISKIRNKKLFDMSTLIGFGFIINVVIINLFNTYFSQIVYGSIIWVVLGIGIYELSHKVKKKERRNGRTLANTISGK